jgi:uncharacterized membrane protein
LLNINNRKLAGRIGWAAFLAGFAAVLFALNATLSYPKPADIQEGNDYQQAKVVQVISDSLAPDPQFPELLIGMQTLELELLSGPQAGQHVVMKNYVTRLANQPADVGTAMIISSYDEFQSGMIAGYDRLPVLALMTMLFLVMVLVISRAKGARSLFGLAFTLLCVLFMFIPLLLHGMNPVLAAVIVVVLSSFVSLAALNGASPKTFVAGMACTVCTLAAGGLALLFGMLLHASSYTTPEAEDLIFIAQSTALSLPDILFAGILIATSGALLDTTMSIASAQSEMQELDEHISPAQLWKSGMNIGKDIMGTMTHTLIMAFAGASINSLLVIFMYQMPLARTLNLDLLVVEMLKGLTGSMALALAIPVTAALGAWAAKRRSGKA